MVSGRRKYDQQESAIQLKPLVKTLLRLILHSQISRYWGPCPQAQIINGVVSNHTKWVVTSLCVLQKLKIAHCRLLPIPYSYKVVFEQKLGRNFPLWQVVLTSPSNFTQTGRSKRSVMSLVKHYAKRTKFDSYLAAALMPALTGGARCECGSLGRSADSMIAFASDRIGFSVRRPTFPAFPRGGHS